MNQGITIGGKTVNEHFEAVNHKKGIDYIKKIVDKKTNISEEVIRELHRIILTSIDDQDAGGALLETLSALLAQYPNAPGHSRAHLTTLENVGTNQRYHLSFYIDFDSSGNLSIGDLNGIQHFEVMPNANWSETKFYSSDLVAEQ